MSVRIWLAALALIERVHRNEDDVQESLNVALDVETFLIELHHVGVWLP